MNAEMLSEYAPHWMSERVTQDIFMKVKLRGLFLS